MNKSYVEEIHLCFTSPAIYCYAYANDYRKACAVYVSFISARSFQNSKFAKNACGNCLYPGMIYTFPVLFCGGAHKHLDITNRKCQCQM
jgi:hypothetical protein